MAQPTDSGAAQAPRHLLAGCLLASVVLHAVLLWLLPGWRMDALPVPPSVLDVVLVSAEPPLPAPASVAPPPRAVAPVPETAVRRPPAVPEVRVPAAVPARREAEVPAVSVPSTAPLADPPRAASPTPAPVPAAPAPVPATAASRGEAPTTPPAFSASYLRNPSPPYPPAARRNGDQGTVMLNVLVSPEGVPLRVELAQSSGSRALDGAAADAVKGWRFVPARRGTLNIEAWVRVPVVFRLEP